MNTQIDYSYKDEYGYGTEKAVVVRGEITSEQRAQIIDSLDEGQFFIGGEVGLPEIQVCMRGFPNHSDHVWLTLSEEDIQLTDKPPTLDVSISDLAQRFRAAAKDQVAASDRLGIRT